jgi:hypothetical protein
MAPLAVAVSKGTGANCPLCDRPPPACGHGLPGAPGRGGAEVARGERSEPRGRRNPANNEPRRGDSETMWAREQRSAGCHGHGDPAVLGRRGRAGATVQRPIAGGFTFAHHTAMANDAMTVAPRLGRVPAMVSRPGDCEGGGDALVSSASLNQSNVPRALPGL